MSDEKKSMARQVLEFVQERGGMVTSPEVAERFGMELIAAREVLNNLLRHSYIKSQPVVYKLTPRGSGHIERSNKTDPRRLELLRARRLKLKEDRAELAERLYRQRLAEATVQKARSVPNSVFAMGGL